MSNLVFNEKTLLEGNLFKFENRLLSAANKFSTEGAILTTYYQIREDATTVDRGLQDIEQLFGHNSPLRYNKIENFPIYGLSPTNPNNSDEVGIEDISVEGEYLIFPSTLVPKPNDFFTINHLKMKGIFQVTEVQYDSMKVEGFYKIRYRLHSTSQETLNNLAKQTVENYCTELDSIGTNINPIFHEEDFVYINKIKLMVNKLIESYLALFYNERHNCFLFHDDQKGIRYFDICGNEFIAKHSLMNIPNSAKAIILHEKIRDRNLSIYYNNSVYAWLELDAPLRRLSKFHYRLMNTYDYIDSSFYRWSEDDVYVMQPLSEIQKGVLIENSIFDDKQFSALSNKDSKVTNEFEKLIHSFIHKGQNISIHDVSLYTGEALLNSINAIEVFLYTPIAIYIIRKILTMS